MRDSIKRKTGSCPMNAAKRARSSQSQSSKMIIIAATKTNGAASIFLINLSVGLVVLFIKELCLIVTLESKFSFTEGLSTQPGFCFSCSCKHAASKIRLLEQRTGLSNPTHGRRWFVQILSTKRLSWSSLSNPTNGSWWMVQILSTYKPSLSSGALRAQH